MSETPLLEFIKPHKLARKAAKLQGKVDLSSLPELSRLALDAHGKVSVALDFTSEEGFSVVTGQASVELPIQCQRCLESMAYPLNATVRLVFIDSVSKEGKPVDMESFQERFEGRYEIYPVDDEQVSLFVLIEQELLLEMPIVPLHEQCDLYIGAAAEPAATDTEPSRRENPFSVLGQLKDQLKTPRD